MAMQGTPPERNEDLPTEPSLTPDQDPARSIRQLFANQLRIRLSSPQTGAPLWEAADMAKRCTKAMIEAGLNPSESIYNMTFGDVDSRMFDGDEGQRVAEALGQIVDGPKRQLIEAYAHQLLLEDQKDPTRESPWGYDTKGIGDPRLRAEFASWIQPFGLSFTSEQTILVHGSFSGLDNVIGALAYQARERGLQTEFLGTGPGFWSIAKLAMMRGVPAIKMNAEALEGYCPTSQTLTELLGEKNLNVSILYETPMSNPTSTVYDPQAFRESLETFVNLRPNGVIVLDLAYVEMIPLEQAIELLNQISPEIRKRIIFSSSMSKLFGYPKLRMAAIQTDNDQMFMELPGHGVDISERENISIFAALQNLWTSTVVTLSEPTELEALAIWKYVSRDDRESLFNIFRSRQIKVLQRIMSVNDEREKRGLPHIVDLSQVHKDVPLYLFMKLPEGVDFLDLFVETGIIGAPGVMFEDSPKNNTLRLAVGKTSLA